MGSRLWRREPGKRVGSCARNVILERRVCLLTRDMSMPSIMMRPDSGGRMARRERASVDLPEPVRPVTAVVVPPGSVQVTEVRAGSRCGA